MRTEAYLRCKAAYEASPRGKEAKRKRDAAYAAKRKLLEQTPEYKATRAAYRKTEARKKAQQRYLAAAPEMSAAKTAKRRFSQAMATPKWLTDDDHWMMKEAYKLARLREKVVGGKWHVDHSVPLRGKNVTGLHVPWNLQVIPAAVNIRKSNHY